MITIAALAMESDRANAAFPVFCSLLDRRSRNPTISK